MKRDFFTLLSNVRDVQQSRIVEMANALRKSPQNIHYSYFQIKGNRVPLRIIKEKRKSARVAIHKNGIFLRMPLFLSRADEEKTRRDLLNWVSAHIEKKPPPYLHLWLRDPESEKQISLCENDTIIVQRRSKTINKARIESTITNTSAKVHSSEMIRLEYPHRWETELSPLEFRNLLNVYLSRFIKKRYLGFIMERVERLNRETVKANLTSVNLRYNENTWGSCSSKQKISLSTRLLLAPLNILDYVILHELCHTQFPNHSKAFHRLVAKFDPEAQDKDNWLRENQYKLYFI